MIRFDVYTHSSFPIKSLFVSSMIGLDVVSNATTSQQITMYEAHKIKTKKLIAWDDLPTI